MEVGLMGRVGLMEVMWNSFKKTFVFSAPDLAGGHCGPTPLLETPGHTQASLSQSLVVDTAKL